jgi:hypothetical protein
VSQETSAGVVDDDVVVFAALVLLVPAPVADSAVVVDTAVVGPLDDGPALTVALLHAATSALDITITTTTPRIPLC